MHTLKLFSSVAEKIKTVSGFIHDLFFYLRNLQRPYIPDYKDTFPMHHQIISKERIVLKAHLLHNSNNNIFIPGVNSYGHHNLCRLICIKFYLNCVVFGWNHYS